MSSAASIESVRGRRDGLALVLGLVLGLVASLIAPASARATDADGLADPTHYHGFLIESGADGTRLDDDHPSLARQIAIVEAVGVPPDVLAFFRSVPIRVERELPRPPGQFVDGARGGGVRILPDGLATDRPILLHELLHAYHAHVAGLRNPAIATAFAAAKKSTDYPARFASAHFLENDREFFAVTSTIFLFGPIRQPPFDCRVPKATQPQYLAFLAARFGPHDCR